MWQQRRAECDSQPETWAIQSAFTPTVSCLVFLFGLFAVFQQLAGTRPHFQYCDSLWLMDRNQSARNWKKTLLYVSLWQKELRICQCLRTDVMRDVSVTKVSKTAARGRSAPWCQSTNWPFVNNSCDRNGPSETFLSRNKESAALRTRSRG